MTALRWIVWLAVAAFCAGCVAPSTRDGGAPDGAVPDGGAADSGNVDHGAPSSTYPAFTVDWPQVEGSDAGVIADPRLVMVTFDGDTLRADLETFTAGLGATAYWQATTAEYGIGPAVALTPVHVAAAAPTYLSDSDIQTFLTQQLDGSHPEWPAPDGRTVYALAYPSTTTITTGNVTSCRYFGGYHSALRLNGVLVPYAVLARCDPVPTVPALSTELGRLTGVAAHEFIEACTDVDPGFLPGYRLPSPQHLGFMTFAGAEVSDMCEFSDAVWVVDGQLGATVQRSWSNAEAKKGHEPCVPAASGPFFTAVPVMNEDVAININGVSLTTRGINLHPGESKTVELQLVSSADTQGPFDVSAIDRQEFFGAGSSLSFNLDRAQGQNGEKLYLTITRTGSDPNFGGAMPFAIVASLGNAKTYWFSVVGAAP